MLKYILGVLLAFTLLALIGIWIIGGGPRKVIEGTQESIASALTPSEEEFRLPWQPASLFPTLDITEVMDLDMQEESGYATFDESNVQMKLAQLEAEYDRLRVEAGRQRSSGPPSPYAGKIGIMQDLSGVRSDDARSEYLQIAAHYGNEESIDIAGWTIESALLGTLIQIPPAASPFLAGSANILGPVSLEPGALVLLISAPSPVGVSFRENMCTGYLGQYQRFEPPLGEECPSPTQVLPLTEENLRQYGDECFDIINDLPACRFPQNLPQNVFPSCRAFLSDSLSYNGCISQNRFRGDFQKNMWRVYLGASGELWRNSHDAIRLLDAQGRTVSVFLY